MSYAPGEINERSASLRMASDSTAADGQIGWAAATMTSPMNEATEKKLREARFFLHRLDQRNAVMQNEPETFEFYLSAFLSAARSVTFVLRSENAAQYEAWSDKWFAERPDDDRALLEFMKHRRNFALKRGDTSMSTTLEFIPATQAAVDSSGRAIYSVQWSGPPGTPPPATGVRVHDFLFHGTRVEVTAICKRYIDLLTELVQDFVQTYSRRTDS